MKKLYLLLIIALIFFPHAYAQQYINYQGKIYSSGIPVNNSSSVFEFSIPSISWTQTFNPVAVINGLYSVTLNLPQNVFDSANYSRQMVVRYGGNYIDTVTLFAPFERDPTVRSYIRDSVLWGNIRNKPTVDTSFSNEIQIIGRNGDTLFLSNGGGYALLPHVSDTLHSTTINGIFTVLDTAKNVMTTVPQSGTVVIGATNQVYWQSFKATANGKLRQLKLSVASSGSSPIITVKFYPGIGNGIYPSVANKTFTISNTITLQTLDISSLSGLPYLSVNNGDIYTFEIIPSTGNTVSILADPSNPYPFGISSISNTTDIPFELSIDNSVPSCLTFDNNCRVGIGTNTPTAQLEVKGRIKDQTGFVMPVGFISAYGGRNIPQGWLLCDGSAISRTIYADLFEAVDSSWGAGNSTTTFNLPDLRGQFLRGVDTSAIVGSNQMDPEHAIRTASNIGGNTGNKVGSLQSEMFKSHNHFTYCTGINVMIGLNSNQYAIGPSTGCTTSQAGGSETRPKNAYVFYIIKF